MHSKPLIVAELSANHLGDLDRARHLVYAAKYSGADAIKLQTFQPNQMVGDKNYVIDSGPWKGRRLLDLYTEAYTPWEWHKTLFDLAAELGMVAFSSPFSSEAVDYLEELNCPMYKIASFEITDLDLIRKAAGTTKPIILSTGMASMSEIESAVDAAAGAKSITILKCTSAYPSKIDDANLAAMSFLQTLFGKGVLTGVSDHSEGHTVPVVAAVLGASMIEKHLTLRRSDGGPDAIFSMEPDEFRSMVKEVRSAMKSMGSSAIGPRDTEKTSQLLRRSLYFDRPLQAGTIIVRDHIKVARPAIGLKPMELWNVVGKRLANDVSTGEPVRWDHLS